MWTSNDFMGPLIYISDMEKYTNSIYLRMSMDGDVGFQWNRILAMSLISIIPSLIVFFCAQDSFIDGIAAGGSRANTDYRRILCHGESSFAFKRNGDRTATEQQ